MALRDLPQYRLGMESHSHLRQVSDAELGNVGSHSLAVSQGFDIAHRRLSEEILGPWIKSLANREDIRQSCLRTGLPGL
jgi:hypothetical protein